MKRYALTAIGRDRPGIVAAVTKVLYDHGCNIEDSSMTILEDEFAIILIMTSPDDIDYRAFELDVEKVEESMGLAIHLKEIGKKARVEEPESNYIITLHGADRAGIVYRTASFLSALGINITDLETKALPSAGRNIYIMVLEVLIPECIDIKEVEKGLNSIGVELGVTIKIKPVEAYEPL